MSDGIQVTASPDAIALAGYSLARALLEVLAERVLSAEEVEHLRQCIESYATSTSADERTSEQAKRLVAAAFGVTESAS